MSSASMTPVTTDELHEDVSSHQSSPPSSPPSENAADVEFDPVSESMQAEEKKMKSANKAKEARARDKAEQEWRNADSASLDAKHQALNKLLEKSKVCYFYASNSM